jgi:hypothetical protein
MSSLATELKASIAWLNQELLGLTTVVDSSSLQYDNTTQNGVANDQADRIWSDRRSVNGAATDDINLTALPLTLFGESGTVSMVNIKAIMIVNLNTTAGDQLVLKGGSQNGWAAWSYVANGQLIIDADSAVLLTAKKSGWTHTDNTHNTIGILNLGANVINYQIVVVGCSQ